MDVCALPNNNHPEKFLQLDVGMLPLTQVGALMLGQRRWQNRVYVQTERRLRAESGPPAPAQASAIPFVDPYLEQHISPRALTSTVKINPLFPAQSSEDAEDGVKAQPSWTAEDYHAQTCANLAEYLKAGQKSARDLDFWLEDVYTPGFDSLLKKTEAQLRRRSLRRFFGLAVVSISAVVLVVVIPVVLLRKTS